jgi:hypothetical protein
MDDGFGNTDLLNNWMTVEFYLDMAAGTATIILKNGEFVFSVTEPIPSASREKPGHLAFTPHRSGSVGVNCKISNVEWGTFTGGAPVVTAPPTDEPTDAPTAEPGVPGMDNFQSGEAYAGQFNDIAGRDMAVWVERVYEYGIVSGKGDGVYDPEGNVTYAEAIVFANKIHAIYKYGTADVITPIPDEEWYAGHIAYAEKEGIIETGRFDMPMNDAATRAVIMRLLAKSLPAGEWGKLNTFTSVHDVDANDAEIIKLYEAGIITGKDERGTFGGDDLVTREQVAAMVARIVDVQWRRTGSTYNS